ncbi:unnamed protein product, partial [Staurois parvus]
CFPRTPPPYLSVILRSTGVFIPSKPELAAPVHAPGNGQTDNSWGPWAIGDHGAPVSLPKLKKAYEKGTRGISWGPLLTPGP